MSAKKLSENKERYGYKKVLAENGVPVPGLWQRLEKYSARVSIVKNGRIFSTFISLKAKSLQKAIDECQKLQAYWAKERNNFKIHEITENALKEEVFLLSRVFTSVLRDLEKESFSVYKKYLQDIQNKEFFEKYSLLIKAHKSYFQVIGRLDDYLNKFTQLDPKQREEWQKEQRQIEAECKQLEQKAKESIDTLFKEALNKEEDSLFFDINDVISEEEEIYTLDKKLEGILGKQFSREMFIPEDDGAEIVTEKGEKLSKALEHYQKSRRKAEGLAFGTKSNTAFKIIQRVIYPLETKIRILRALCCYCPKEGQEPKESK